MLLFTITFGGLLLMMGHHTRSEALFYYFRLEDQVPENHLLRLIDEHISFVFVREQLKESYSETGRPSIEKTGLQQDAIGSQVIDALEAQEIKETGNEED